MDIKVIRKKVLNIVIPLILIAAVTVSLVFMASAGETVKYVNITSEDYDLADGDYDLINAPACKYEGFLPVAQKGNFTMYVNSSTSAVAIYDSATGRTLSSIIPEEEFDIANSYNSDTLAYMRSNFILTAVNMSTGNTSDYSMYDSLQSNGKFSIEGIEDGVRITYLIGKIPETYTVPNALSEKRYNEIVKQLGEIDAIVFENRYMLLDISQYYGDEKREYLEQYPTCEKEKIYVINSDKKFILREIEELLQKIGYTEEQKSKDEKEVTANFKEESYTVFRIPMEFKLSEDNFSVSIDRGDILYGDEALPIYIEVCPYLMRAYSDESGYALLPDGSGSIMKLNNGKTQANGYLAQVYGEDPLFYENFTRSESQSVQLPVYGLKSQNGGIFAYISDCAADSYIKADISGKNSDTNNVYTRFKLFGFKKEMVTQDWTSTGNGTIYNVRIQGDSISGECTTRYYLLPKGKCEYLDMALLCREIFKNEGILKSSADVNNNTALVNLLGVYDYTKSFLGIPIDSNRVMTNADQAIEIVSSLKEQGITADVRYLAAVNGGYRQTAANGMNLASGIGSSKQLKQLKSSVEENGGKLYMELSFAKVYKNELFDGFVASKDSVAKINTEHTAFFERDPISFYYVKTPHYYLSSLKFKTNMDKVLKDVKKLDNVGIAFRSIGDTLYSDADTENFASRDTVEMRFSEAANSALEKNISLMYNGGGAYVLPSASYLAGIASTFADYAITDESVPFLQMVIHGSVPYTYESVLNSSNITNLMLNSAATGAKLQFDVSANSSYELKTTEYSEYYNTGWESNNTKIKECCEFMRAAIEKTADKEFVSFEYVTDSVTKSVFSDDVTVYVNYSDKDFSLGGITVKAQNYAIVE